MQVIMPLHVNKSESDPDTGRSTGIFLSITKYFVNISKRFLMNPVDGEQIQIYFLLYFDFEYFILINKITINEIQLEKLRLWLGGRGSKNLRPYFGGKNLDQFS